MYANLGGCVTALGIALVALSAPHLVRALYEGDIMLTREQQHTLEASSNPHNPFSPQRAVVRNMRNLWPRPVVPYVIDASLGMTHTMSGHTIIFMR